MGGYERESVGVHGRHEREIETGRERENERERERTGGL